MRPFRWLASSPPGPDRFRMTGTMSSALIFPCEASLCLATSDGSNLYKRLCLTPLADGALTLPVRESA